MKHKLILFTFLILLGLDGSYGNGGEHGHGHHHHHDHDHGADIDGGEDLESLIKNFGIAVLGKDQESADDVQPTADHSHVNIKALINELFHPSSTSTTTTTTPLTTSTQRLPIKAHDLGWDLSPIDLVMSNSILEPIFTRDQHERQARKLGPTYLTETPYLASDDNFDESELSNQLRHPPLREQVGNHLKKKLDLDQLIDKPTLPVLDIRRANFLLVNGRRRSKTNNRKSSDSRRQKSEKAHHDGDILWRKTSSEHENPEFGGKKLSAKASHKHHSDKKCNHEEDDILWRETVSHQNFITTSPHSFIPSDETTVTPLSDLSRFLLPPTFQEPDNEHQGISLDGQPITHSADHGNLHHPPSAQGKTIGHSFRNSVQQGKGFLPPTHHLSEPETDHKNHPSNNIHENDQDVIQSALSQVQHDVMVAARKHPLNNNKKGGLSSRPENFRQLSHKNRNENGGKIGDKSRSVSVKDDRRNAPRFAHAQNSLESDELARSVFQQTTIPITRRGKKNDDNLESNHQVHEHLRDDVVEDFILQDDSTHSHSTFNAHSDDMIFASQAAKSKSNFDNRVGRKGKKIQQTYGSKSVNNIHTTQDKHIHHDMMMSMTKEGIKGGMMDCKDKSEGLHADISSGCQRFFMCHENGRSGRFTCPVGTLFSDTLGVCDWAKRVNCPNIHP